MARPGKGSKDSEIGRNHQYQLNRRDRPNFKYMRYRWNKNNSKIADSKKISTPTEACRKEKIPYIRPAKRSSGSNKQNRRLNGICGGNSCGADHPDTSFNVFDILANKEDGSQKPIDVITISSENNEEESSVVENKRNTNPNERDSTSSKRTVAGNHITEKNILPHTSKIQTSKAVEVITLESDEYGAVLFPSEINVIAAKKIPVVESTSAESRLTAIETELGETSKFIRNRFWANQGNISACNTFTAASSVTGFLNQVTDKERNSIVVDDFTRKADAFSNPFDGKRSETTFSVCQSLSPPKINNSRVFTPSYRFHLCNPYISNSLGVPNVTVNDFNTLVVSDMTAKFVDLLSEASARYYKQLLRQWEVVQQKVQRNGSHLRVCSYNVLCQQTASETMFLYKHLTSSSQTNQIDWYHRSTLLAREFKMMEADIFCLQEVQDDHFVTFFEPFFRSQGYKSRFKKRTRDKVDGCAIFYKTNLELISYTDIEYFVSEKCVLDRDNVGQLARFRDKHVKRDFCVANTHLLYNRRRGDVKLAQLAMLIAFMDRECGPASKKECPFIICGDFNITPHSPLYCFLMEGYLSFAGIRQYTLSGQNQVGGPIVRPNLMPRETNIGRNCRFKNGKGVHLPPDTWTHPLQLASIYKHYCKDNTPEVSSFSAEATNPDFVFYSVKSKLIEKTNSVNPEGTVNVFEGPLILLRRLTLPSESILRSTFGPWPNAITPSDHIPLIADFLLI